MSALVKLRVATAFNVYRVGDVIERLPGVARQMLAARWYGRRLVEAVEPPPESAPAARKPARKKAKPEPVATPEQQP